MQTTSRTEDRADFAPAESDNIIQSLFGSMMDEADRRHDRFRPAVMAAPERGACPGCDEPVATVDVQASLIASVERNAVMIVREACDACTHEAGMQETLARYGVPRRVRAATFGNYEIYDDRQTKAVGAVKAWLRDPEHWCLILIGRTGAGKGHLAAACVRALNQRAAWTNHVDLVNDYHGTPFEGRKKFLDRFKRFPTVVIDEIGGKTLTADTPEIFYGVLNIRHEEAHKTGAKTILIGNVPYRSEDPSKLSMLTLFGSDRLESRLAQHATIVTCKWPDFRTRNA